MAISQDASTSSAPTELTEVTTGTSASFSPPAATLVVVMAGVEWNTAPTGGITVTLADSHGNAYAAGPVVSSGAGTTSAMFSFWYATAPGPTTVTLTRSPSTEGGVALWPVVLDGASPSQSGAATAVNHSGPGSENPYGTFTTSQVGSWVLFCAVIDATTETVTPVGSGTTLATWSDSYNGGYFAFGRQSAATVTPGAGSLGWTSSATADWSWAAMEILAGSATISGGALLSGSGTLGGAAAVVAPGAAALAGSGTMAAAGVISHAVALSGSGSLGGPGPQVLAPGSGAALLSGSGTLSAGRHVTWAQGALLSGSGTMTPVFSAAYGNIMLAGSGTMTEAVVLTYPVALSGSGTLSVLKVLGGLVLASAPVSVPRAYPGTSQVAVAAPGSSNWMYLGSAGQVTALTYSFTCPGGCDAMTATLMVPASYRNQMLNPGWQVRITRGGHQVWRGKLDEPVPTASGWNLTASGTGNRGQDYVAYYTSTWPAGQPDQSVNDAISRGMPWVNPGIGTPSGAWFGQAVDPGAQTITALLNLICTRGALTWYVNSQPGGLAGDDLSVFPLPSTVNRLLVCTTPVARTLNGDINTIWLRYNSAAAASDSTAPATYGTTSVVNAASVAMHGPLEVYLDLSDAGVMDAAAAEEVGDAVLQLYTRASFAGPFSASYGQLLNTGGVPVDPGTDQGGNVVRLLLTDFGQGGELVLNEPITFTVGSYEWDDFAQVATLTPYASVDNSLQGLLSLATQLITPISVSS